MVRTPMSRLDVRVALATVIALVGLAGLPGAAGGAPRNVVLTLRIESGSGNVRLGTFTATPPFCAAGSFERRLTSGRYEATNTCADGSGTIVIQPGASVAGTSTLSIIGGTGNYADLRGRGSCAHDARELTLEHCQALVDHDAVGPEARDLAVKVTLQKPKKSRRYSLRVSFKPVDNLAENSVRYELMVDAGLQRIRRSGATTRPVGFTLALRATKNVRSLRLTLTMTDPVGNESSVSRAIRLPR